MRFIKPLRIQSQSNGFFQKAIQSLQPTIGLDFAAYGRLIQHCTDRRLLRQGKQLHARLVVSSVVPGNFLASKLIAFYSKSDCIGYARNVFDQIPNRNTFSGNAMLIAYSLHSMHFDTLKLFSSLVSSPLGGVKADNFTVTCVMKALADLFSRSRLAKEVHCYVVRHGFDSDIFVLNALLMLYSRCDELGVARVLFDRMKERDLVSWNSMIAGYSQGGFYLECKKLYKEMLEGPRELRPNAVTVLSILQACGQSKDLAFGIEVHRFMDENQIEKDVSLCNALVALYAKCGSLDYAREFFEDLKEKDEVTYGSMISGYMAHGFFENAMDLFHKMEKPGLSTWNAVISGLVQNNQHQRVLDLFLAMQASGFRPNMVTLSSVLPTISHFLYLKGGKEIHAYALRSSYDQNIYVSTAIIDTYAKSGYLHGARGVFDQSKGRSLIIWTAIISAYAAHGDAETCLCLFNEMVNNGIWPDEVTFIAVLTSCAHCGLVDEARKIFDSMLPKYGIQPSMEHYACVVTALSRAGRLSEATEFVSKLPVEPSAKIWGALLNGALESGDVELGKVVYSHLFEIEPENTGNYVIMANLYSQAGRCEEADEVRERMNEIGLKKLAGSSWIETNGGLGSQLASVTNRRNFRDL